MGFSDISERQHRNREWVASHPLAVALMGAVLMGVISSAIGMVKWGKGGALLMMLLGLSAGCFGGVAWSIENRELNHDSRPRSPIYFLGIFLLVVLIIALKF
jgi:hypothetical protein